MAERFISIREVLNRTSLSKTEIYRRIRAGKFPRAAPLSPARVAWLESEVEAWMDARVADRGGP